MVTEQVKSDSVVINGHEFVPIPGVTYRKNYPAVARNIARGKIQELPTYRTLVAKDSFFFLHFVLGIKQANHPFIVDLCRELDEGPVSHTLHLYAREHFKSTAITTTRSIQDVLCDSEKCVGIFSHTRPIATGFLRNIKFILESSEFLKYLFPDVLYTNPDREAFIWSLDGGLYLKRKSIGRKEATFEAAGLLEGMPTGKHYDIRVYDDVETHDSVQSPEMIQKLCDAFDMSSNLGTKDGWVRVVGTTYHHEGLLQKLRHRKKDDGVPAYQTIVRAATKDGTPNGESSFLPEERLSELRQNLQMFYSQQLLDPTPRGTQKLDFHRIQRVPVSALPERLYKFMLIDPAGTRKDRQGDSWAMWVVGVEPVIDDLGASRVFLLDGCIEIMNHDEAMRSAVELYSRNGRILTMGVEKVGLSSAEVHISNALRARGKYITVENGGITLLRPNGRSKQDRIEGNLMWPLNNGKIYVCETCPAGCVQRLQFEMEKFPFWHDDALDALSYVFDLVKDYRFGKVRELVKKPRSVWDSDPKSDAKGWMYC